MNSSRTLPICKLLRPALLLCLGVVQIGWRSGDRVEIVHGLAEGERVVVEGTFLVDSKSRLKSTAPRPDCKPAPATNPSHT